MTSGSKERDASGVTDGDVLPVGRARVPYGDPGTPDYRSPLRYMWWLVVRQRGRVSRGALWGSLWMTALMLPPYFIARAIDDGVRERSTSALIPWIAAILAIGAVNAILGLLRHRTMTLIRVDAAYRTVQLVVRQVVRLGATLPRRISAGELTNVQVGDSWRIAQTLTITGPGVGAVIAYLAAAVLLFGISPLLAVVVLLGVPLLALALGPLLGKLRGVEEVYREQQGALTARAGDLVSGLGVLAGIGGKSIFAGQYRRRSAALRDDGYRVGAVTSWVEAVGVCLPVLFLAAITWIGARLAAAGDITVGELVAVYGYVAVLIVPISFFIEGAGDLTRGLVAAGRVVRVLGIKPDVEARDEGVPGPAAGLDLCDPDTGVVVPGGRLSALVTDRPADAKALLDRLGGYVDSEVSWGGVQLSGIRVSEVRRRVLLADNDAYMFAGPLRETVSPRRGLSDQDIMAALRTAAAEDVVAARSGGLDSPVQASAADVSGGQRQRLRLARVVLADPEVLLLVEPTSAVDAHTEAVLADRIRTARAGRTTLLVTTSPLLLDRVDHVIHVVDGRVAAVGTHRELLATQSGYRAVVHRDSSAPAAEAHR